MEATDSNGDVTGGGKGNGVSQMPTLKFSVSDNFLSVTIFFI